MENYTEASIPSFVWKFVKKNTSNVITAGILALIIWNFIKKRQKESYSDSELQDIMNEALYYNKTDKDGAHYTNKVSKEEEWDVLVKNSKVSGTKTLYDGEFKLSDSELDYIRNKLKSKGLIESLDLTSVKLSKSWGDCKRNSDLIQSKIGGKVKSVFSPTVDGINGHYYWTDGTYVVDYVIHNQKDIYSKLRSKEIDTGVWKLVDYRNILDLKESYLERLEELSEEYKNLSDDDVLFLDNINKYALLKINYKSAGNTQWLSDRINEQKNNVLWKNLTTDKSSAKHFKIESMDPTEGIFFVKTDFLIRQAGNKTGGLGKEDSIRDAFKKGTKLSTPQYWLRDGELGEGNHRVMVAKEFGFKSVPVRVYWK